MATRTPSGVSEMEAIKVRKAMTKRKTRMRRTTWQQARLLYRNHLNHDFKRSAQGMGLQHLRFGMNVVKHIKQLKNNTSSCTSTPLVNEFGVVIMFASLASQGCLIAYSMSGSQPPAGASAIKGP